MRDSWYTQQLG